MAFISCDDGYRNDDQCNLVAQIEFTEWTPDGHLRHASYLGLRDDKEARDVVRETES